MLRKTLSEVAELKRAEWVTVENILQAFSAYIQVADTLSLSMIEETLAPVPQLQEMNRRLAEVEEALQHFRERNYQLFFGTLNEANEGSASAL